MVKISDVQFTDKSKSGSLVFCKCDQKTDKTDHEMCFWCDPTTKWPIGIGLMAVIVFYGIKVL